MATANERRIIELILKATGDVEVKRLARELGELKKATNDNQISSGRFGSSLQNVGFQVQDFAVQVGGGTSAMRAFSQQAPQMIGALSGVFKEGGKLAAFFGGPWGVALGIAAAVVGPLIARLYDTSDAADTARSALERLTKESGTVADEAATQIEIAKKQQELAFGERGWGETDRAFKLRQAALRQEVKELQQLVRWNEAVRTSRNADSTPRVTGARPSGGGGGGGSQRAAEVKQEREELTLYEQTMQLVNVQLVEMSGNLSGVYDEEQRALEQLSGQLGDAWFKRREAQQDELRQMQEQWKFLADAMGKATYDIIAGTESISRAVKRMVASIVSDLVKLALQKAVLSVFGLNVTTSADGNVFGSGGIVSTPTVHRMANGGIGVMGEAGPEAVMPLARNSRGQLGVVSTGGNVTVNNYAGAAITTRQTDQGLQIDVIERQLADRIRRGGTSLPGALENTYRNGRYAGAY